MIPQKTKKQKCSNYKNNFAKTNNNTGDQKNVLILPPLLLQKLGINLEDIQSSKSCASNMKIGDSSKSKYSNVVVKTEREEIDEKTDLPNISSILETANLMKASVFLSPTFTRSKSILDEESNNFEMSVEDNSTNPIQMIRADDPIRHYNADEFKSEEIKCSNLKNNNGNCLETESYSEQGLDVIHREESTKVLTKKKENVLEPKNQLNILSKAVPGYGSCKGLIVVSSLDNSVVKVPASKDTIISLNNNTMNKNISTSLNDDCKFYDYKREKELNESNTTKEHLLRTSVKKFDEEKYNHSNIGFTTNSPNISENANGIEENNSVCEFPETKLHIENQCKSNSSQDERVLFGVTEPLLLGEQEQSNITMTAKEISKITLTNTVNLQFSEIKGYKNDIPNEYNASFNKKIRYDNISECCEVAHVKVADTHDDLMSPPELLQSINNTDAESNLSLDKVEEIAYYLGQHFYAEHNRNYNIGKTVNNTQHKSNSKLSIEGVEKPGGSIKMTHQNNAIKTYSRDKRTKSFDIATLTPHTGYIKDIIIDYNINDKSFESISCRNFCLCDDFGSFFHYDSDRNYQHIHFWDQNHVQCSMETLLSIYHDYNFEHYHEQKNNLNMNITHDTDTENQLEITDDAVLNFCWSHSFNYPKSPVKCLVQHYKETEDVNDGEGQNDEDNNKFSKGKRKRIDNTSDNESDYEKKSVKKPFELAQTCRAYNTKVSKFDMNNHKSKGHCSIAWKNGQEIYAKETDTEMNTEIVIKASTINDDVKENATNSVPVLFVQSDDVYEYVGLNKRHSEARQLNDLSELLKSKTKQYSNKNVIKVETVQKQAHKHVEYVPQHKLEDNIIKEHSLKCTIDPVPQMKTREKQAIVTRVVESVVDHPQIHRELKHEAKEHALGSEKKPVPQIETKQKQATEERVLESIVDLGVKEVPEALVSEVDADDKYVTCAVCREVLFDSLWVEHITKKHNYIAWRDGDAPLDCTDEDEVRDYLNSVIKEIGELVCAGCGLKRKFAKLYLKHIKNCHSINADETNTEERIVRVISAIDVESEQNLGQFKENQKTDLSEIKTCTVQDIIDQTVLQTEINDKQVVGEVETGVNEVEKLVLEVDTTDKYITCGVCQKVLLESLWIEHISQKHNYIAWKIGEMPLDLTDEDMIRDYLNNVIKEIGELVCKTCGLKRKFAKSYLKHIKNCQSMKRKRTDNTSDAELDIDMPILKKTCESSVICGVCNDNVPIYNWDDHIYQEHCFIAWKNGQKIDLNSSDLMRNLRRVLRDNNKLICTFCKFEKCDVNKFVKHVRKCIRKYDKDNNTDEETEIIIEVPAVNVKSGQMSAQSVQHRQVETGVKEIADKLVVEVDTDDSYVTCALCRKIVRERLWVKHISRKHNYIAWRDGEVPLDCMDEEMMQDHLNYVIREIGEIICKRCGLKRKFAKSYLKHIKNCHRTEESDEGSTDETRVVVKRETVKIEDFNIKCGVCQLEMKDSQWIDHIFKEHDYLAWKEGDPPFDLNDSKQVYDHLFSLAKKNDGLICKKCGCRRKYIKTYMKHVETCDGETTDVNNSALNESQNNTVNAIILDLSDDEEANVTCGVCKMDVEGKNWLNHIQMEHGYLAWKEGKPALNLEDNEEIQNYLHLISKKYNGLICNKCGLQRKYVRVYLSHIESCESNLLNSSVIGDISDKDSYECGVCAEVVDARDWKSHAMKNHYNIAWVVGDYPIDVKNPGAVEKHLKEYKQLFGKLKCKKCDTTRVSLMGFYAHIIQCGKTEEEIDQFKIYCEICNSGYLCIYKHQHATMHREQEYAKARKMLMEAQEKKIMDSVKTEQITERRRAAEKAREFIAKAETFSHICNTCGFGADEQAELDEHICGQIKNFSDSENSGTPESSDDESVDTIADTDLSGEEEQNWKEDRRKKKHGDSSSAATRVPRIPFAVKCAKTYLKQSTDDYRKNYLTNELLFPQWRSCRTELVSSDQIQGYLPTVKESCKVILDRGGYTTFRQFEAKKDVGLSIFVGGCIQCISWAPPHVDDRNDLFGHYLAVACNNSFDSNRLDCDKTYEHSGLLQIWDFGNLISTKPEFALGIAHDYGTIWAIDWCPSGVRDEFPPEHIEESITEKVLRLGLLAVACSNGSAYIFSVPYPSSVTTNKTDKIYKLTPVAELKLSRGQRDVFQATSISWSQQNKHTTVVVGYSDGTIALYNLDYDSPLLMDRECGVDIFYPYRDERPHNSSIADVKTFPSSEGAGLISSVSPTGSSTSQQQGCATVYGHLSSTSSAFAPHWPALMLSGNEIIVNQAVNELDWWGFGRRTGSVQTCCGCWQCGRMAMFTPPVLRIMTTHPVYSDFNKETIAIIQMKQIGQKRTKLKNDDLQLKLEPISYNDAVKTYALDFKLTKDFNKETIKEINKPRKQYPERFPLSNVPSMAFYPSQNHHRKLAVATHAGVVFILTV